MAGRRGRGRGTQAKAVRAARYPMSAEMIDLSSQSWTAGTEVTLFDLNNSDFDLPVEVRKVTFNGYIFSATDKTVTVRKGWLHMEESADPNFALDSADNVEDQIRRAPGSKSLMRLNNHICAQLGAGVKKLKWSIQRIVLQEGEELRLTIMPDQTASDMVVKGYFIYTYRSL